MASRTPFLERLALHRPELRAWAMYDWANSAMYTVIVTAVFPIFFSKVAAQGLDDDHKRTIFMGATTVAMLIAALISPVLGTMSDYTRAKKKLFALFLTLGVGSCAAMFFIGPGEWRFAAIAFGLCNIGAVGSFVFYDALLPHVAKGDEMDRLSTTAYAVGYLGGGLCLALAVCMIKWPATFGLDGSTALPALPTRAAFVLVAVWWSVFTIPFFRRVREPELALERDERPDENPLRVAFARIGGTLRELRTYRMAFLFMIAFLVFNDGIGTIVRMALLFGEERKIPDDVMLECILLVQLVGIPFTVLFGRLAGWFGPKRAILIAIAAYVGITVQAYFMASVTQFVLMAVSVGMVQGGAQALSRSLFASLVPKHKSGEFFGLFSTLEKFAGLLGPLIFTVSATSGSAILSLIAFFAVGGAILCFVDVDVGRKQVQEVERALVLEAQASACSRDGS